MDSGMSYLEADRIAKANPGLTAKKIRRMSMSEFAKLTGREPFRPTPQAPSRPAPGVAPQVEATRIDESEPEPEPVSVKDMTFKEYSAFRAKIGMGQSTKNVGIFGR
jgi:hypothetical protein